MKRIFGCAAMFLAIANGVLGLAACGGGSEDAAAVTGSPAPLPAPMPAPTPQPAPSPSITYSVTVSWSVPLLNTDGTSLTDIGGYRVYYGLSADNLSESISVSGAGITSHVVSNLPPGTYYIAVATWNSMGVTSGLSTPASKTVP